MLRHFSGSRGSRLDKDEFAVSYHIENAQQFWSELDELLRLPDDSAVVTLSLLDTTLRRTVSLCASYHQQYLQSPLQLEHACQQLLGSELFKFHSERMCRLIIEDAQTETDPHVQFILYSILLHFGRRDGTFFRSNRRWKPLIPLLMDHTLVDIDFENEFLYLPPSSSSVGNSRHSTVMGPVIIEAKLRCLSVQLLYEVCRVQNLSEQELRVFTDTSIDNLFEAVEQTKLILDESFNYSVIKLLLALNEKFMVAETAHRKSAPSGMSANFCNRVLDVLKSRLGSSKTFGQNMIFMLNRASNSTEDLCMQFLVLKLLYLLLASKTTSDFFYTNDLRVLVDVFLRQLVDLGEENEALRQTYLRVLHPLLTRTQLRNIHYKRPQIVMILEALIRPSQFREVNSDTERLVRRCLSGDWCVQLRGSSVNKGVIMAEGTLHQDSPSQEVLVSTTQDISPTQPPMSATLERSSSISNSKQIKASRSIDNLKATLSPRPGTEPFRRQSAESAASFGGLPTTASAAAPRKPSKSGSLDNETLPSQQYPGLHIKLHSSQGAVGLPSNSTTTQKPRRPPPPPPKRRPPTAIGVTNGGAIMTAIASSSSSALKKRDNHR
ncbi:hypothetical protein V8B97DRAFT_1511996 [Scleroderma yunnanense]